MNDFIKDTTEIPSLSFGAPEPEPELPVQQPEEKKEVMDDSVLSDEQKAMVDAFVSQIDLANTNGILQYGAGAQKKMADFSEKTLENVRSKDLGEIGDLLTSVVTELKTFDAEEEKGPFSFFKKSTNKINAMKAKYDKAEVNVNKICDVLDGHQRQLLKDIAILDQMYAQNLNYFKELTMYILAGKKKLELVRSTELRDLQNKAQMTGKAEDAQAAKDLEDLCNRFEKKLYDLELTRMVSIQTAPQIRMIQNSDSVMAEKIQSTLVNTIPLWKNQMIIALGVHHSTEAAKAQRQVSDMTNELLKKNAENLKMATIETAKESERGIIDMETLKQTNQSLISTLDEVMKIQEDGRQKRAAAEVELVQLENDIKKKCWSFLQADSTDTFVSYMKKTEKPLFLWFLRFLRPVSPLSRAFCLFILSSVFREIKFNIKAGLLIALFYHLPIR